MASNTKTMSRATARQSRHYRGKKQVGSRELNKVLALLECGFVAWHIADEAWIDKRVIYKMRKRNNLAEDYILKLDRRIGLPEKSELEDAYNLTTQQIKKKFLDDKFEAQDNPTKQEQELKDSKKHKLKGKDLVNASLGLEESPDNLLIDNKGNLSLEKLERAKGLLANKFAKGADRLLNSISAMSEEQLAKSSLGDKARALQIMTDKILLLTKEDEAKADLDSTTESLLNIISKTIPMRKKDGLYEADDADDAEITEEEKNNG